MILGEILQFAASYIASFSERLLKWQFTRKTEGQKQPKPRNGHITLEGRCLISNYRTDISMAFYHEDLRYFLRIPVDSILASVTGTLKDLLFSDIIFAHNVCFGNTRPRPPRGH